MLIYLHDTVFFVTFAATKKIIMKKLLYLLIALSIYGCAEEKKEEPKLKFSEVYNRHVNRSLDFDKNYFNKEVYIRPGQNIKSKRKKMETRNNVYMQLCYVFNNKKLDIPISEFNKNPEKYFNYYIRMRDDDGLDYDVDVFSLGAAQEAGLHVFRYTKGKTSIKKRSIDEKYSKYLRNY